MMMMTPPWSPAGLRGAAALLLLACGTQPTDRGVDPIDPDPDPTPGAGSTLVDDPPVSIGAGLLPDEEHSGDPDAWVQIALGTYHSCGIRGDGTLWCWGDGRSGQRGDASDDAIRAAPQRVLAAGEAADGAFWRDWIAVSARGFTTCGLRRDGSLWCWGEGSFGELGDGTFNDATLTPSRVVAAAASDAPWSDWAAVSVGYTHACGLREGGSLWCWGFAADGRLGHGVDQGETSRPVQVVQAEAQLGGAVWTDWVSVSAGARSVCAIREGGSLWCWGESVFGQRGDGIRGFDSRASPTRVLAEDGGAAHSDWHQVQAGDHHACGLRDGGDGASTAWCWGRNHRGQLGIASWDVTRSLPSAVLQTDAAEGGESWSDWVALGAGVALTCGQRADGALYCWGSGGYGQRGDGLPFDEFDTPAPVLASGGEWGEPGWTDWTAFAVGDYHACGIREDASLWCWGDGSYGQRGDGSVTAERFTPIRVVDP